MDHGAIIFRISGGAKLAALLQAPLVAFEADGRIPGAPAEAWSVVLKGRTGEVRRLVDIVAAADLPLFPWHASALRRFIRVVPHEVTGRRFAVAEAGFWDTTFVELAPHRGRSRRPAGVDQPAVASGCSASHPRR